MEHYRRYGYVFVGPALGFMALTLLYPMLQGVVISFLEMGIELTSRFVGIKNYAAIIGSTEFWASIWNTVVFAVISTLGSLIVGLGLALLLDLRDLRFRTFWRVLFLMPWTISHVAAGLGWKWIFDGLYGIANDVLLRLTLITEPIIWLGSRDYAMACVVVANIWRSYPFIMLILLASLQTIPQEQYESASIDGATARQRFRYITLPNLRFAIFVATTLEFIFNVRQFDIIFVMTKGGPRNSTEVLATLVNRQAFEYFDYGSAAATSVLMLLMPVAATLLYKRLMTQASQRTA